MPEELHISLKELITLTKRFIEKIPKNRFDYLLCIPTGGVVFGRFVKDYLNLPLGFISASAYKQGERKPRDNRVVIGNLSITEPLGERVLLLDDLVDTGITMDAICNHLKKNYDIKIIETGVLYKKNQTIFQPHYWVEETSKWVIFPYERNEFLREKINRK
jgi:hypoxanthine phosphoribosyltransferase